MWSEVNGATFQDLMSLTNSNYGALSQAISMKGVGAAYVDAFWVKPYKTAFLNSFKV